MRNIIIIFVITLCGWQIADGQASSSVDSLYSESLGRTVPFSVLLPSGYDPAVKYPVMYLLHGVNSDYQTWLNRSDIEVHIDTYPMVVIMPNGELSFYINAYNEPKDRFEDYLINDLPEYVEQKYSVDTGKQVIAGFSMGGYGATTLALKHPERFKYAVSISGALSGARRIEELKARPSLAFLVPALNRVFGEEPNDYRVAHDPFELYKKTPPEKLPYFFLIFGSDDPNPDIITDQKEFSGLLNDYGAYYEYHEVPGQHNYSRTGDAAVSLLFARMAYLDTHTPRSFTSMLEKKITTDGIVGVMAWYHRDIKPRQDSPYYIDMAELNGLGYRLIDEGRHDEAIAVFGIAVDAFPQSANINDSMSDAYLAKGDTAKAIKAVRRCLELIPADSSLGENFAADLKEIAENKLKSLEGK